MSPFAFRAPAPSILFGAFDRHNLGDLLFPHVAAALLPAKSLRYAGLVERDLRGVGGHRVEAIARLAAEWRDQPVDIVHVGGELLTCSAWEAAAMLLPPDAAQATIAYFEAHPLEKTEWVQSFLGLEASAPYTVSRKLFAQANRMVYCGVGGVDLDDRAPALRDEAIANLRAADAVGVRDWRTHAYLHAAGIKTRLMPDPAAMVAELFGEQICERSQEIEGLLHAFPQGYIAVQFSADFGNDATLEQIATQLDEASSSCGYGICFFRAGAAPWHDDAECYRRVAARMRGPTWIFDSLNVWAICALIANSRGYCGSSLHGRIVAMAFGVPRINLLHPVQSGRVTKQAAYAETWEAKGLLATTGIQGIAEGLRQALTADPALLQQTASELATRYRTEFSSLAGSIA